MSLITSIRLRSFKKQLLKELKLQNRRRKVSTIWSARRIGILFDATQPTERDELLQFARALEKEGKTVRLLGFINDKKELGQLSFDCFNRKMTNWNGIPKPEQTAAFVKEKFDLLLVVNLGGHQPLEWVAAQSQAAMKIGSATLNPNDFDIMLGTEPGKTVQYFLEQLDIYLDKIVLTNEHAFAEI